MVVHVVSSMESSTIKKVLHGTKNAYDDYRSYKPIQDIYTNVVGKVRKGIKYADALHQGS